MFSPLCKYCLSIPLTNDSAYHPHHPSATALLASAAVGCSLCTVVCDAFQHTSWPSGTAFGHDAIQFHFYIENDATGEKHIPTIYFLVEFLNRDMNRALEWNGKRGRWERFEVYVPILIVPVDDPYVATPATAPNGITESREPSYWTHRWLSECVESHSKCQSSNQTRQLPTRLLDLGTGTNSSIRLHLSDGRPSTERYVTLSHCWGSTEISHDIDYSLKVETLESMLENIEVATLPKTFRDSIIITRQLGIRYLWIDSLCIIQGNDEDWARESSMMGTVYQNGYCNIAATAADDGSVGCFRPRNALLAQTCRVRLEKDLKKFRLKRGVYDFVPRTLWADGLDAAPLLKRAWVVQERFFARRVLHFARNQLFWECYELDACEMYPLGAPPSLVQPISTGFVTGGQEYGFLKLRFKNLDPSSVRSEVKVLKVPWTFSVIPQLPSGPQIDPYYVWNKVVIAYTRCDLSFEMDRLVAVSAIARQIQTMTKDVYLAGIWRRHLPYHLMWVSNHQIVPRVRVKAEYVAPSWSWASKTKAIEPYVYIRPDCPSMIQILSTSTVPKTSDAMGQVVSGHIQLRGWLRKFCITTPMPPVELFKPPTISNTVEFDEIPIPGEREVWFLPVISLGSWVTFEALGLLLEANGKDGEFKRVGRFRDGNDVAKRFFRRPTYPLEAQNGPGTGIRPATGVEISSGGRKGWFGSKIQTDEGLYWRERTITIF